MSYNSSQSIAWTANSEPDLAGYKVYAGTASHIYSKSQDVGNVLTATLTGLDNGLTWYFAVTAYDASANESTFSAEISKLMTATTLQLLRRVA